MGIAADIRRQACNAITEVTTGALADIGNTYRAVHMQHTGWITSGRYHHMDPIQEIAEREAAKEQEKAPEAPAIKGPEIKGPDIKGPEPDEPEINH